MVNLSYSCIPNPKFTSFAFHSSETHKLLDELGFFGGTDPIVFFPQFYKIISDALAPKVPSIFRNLTRLGRFSVSWRAANITPIHKKTVSVLPEEYRFTSITPILSKIFDSLPTKRFTKFPDIDNILQPHHQFAFRKSLSSCDPLLILLKDLQESLGAALDFSSVFDLVNHKALTFKLKFSGVSGHAFDITSEFLTDRKQRVVVNG